MANALFEQGKHELVNGLDWINDDIKVLLIDTGAHTIDLSADTTHSDITGAAIIATSANMTAKSAVNGVIDAADFTFTAVSGVSCEAGRFPWFGFDGCGGTVGRSSWRLRCRLCQQHDLGGGGRLARWIACSCHAR